uniref:DUF4220 domain-containing protein n=1 Tax=Aegilops tauschii TaxID=37682 RepID=N1QPL9_AEGTA
MSLSCDASGHVFLILWWVCLAQIIGTNTSTMVAADDREGRNNSIPVILLAQAMWTLNLVFGFHFLFFYKLLLWIFTILLLAKLGLKCFAFWMARHSLAHGRNPRIIVGYMMQLHKRSQHAGPTIEQNLETSDKQLLPPPLIVMGEERQTVEKNPQDTTQLFFSHTFGFFSVWAIKVRTSRYEVLVKLLSIPEAHEVLQKGASLATQLVMEDGSTAWGVLAEFWSEMILHAASSSKLENHAEAMAGGAELITLLWALVMHAGPAPAPKPSTVVAPSAEVEVLVTH